MLTIDNAQLNRLDDENHRRFEQRCVAFLRQHFPERDALSPPPRQLASVRAGLAAARFRGLHNEDDLVLYLYLRTLLGDGFDLRTDTPAGAAMNDRSLPPSERLAVASARVAAGEASA